MTYLIYPEFKVETLKLDKAEVDLAELVDTSLNEQLLQMQEKHLHYWFDRGFSGVNTYCDRHRMYQVISNVISNAIKFSPVKSEIKITLSLDKQQVKIRISDQGEGIPEMELTNIFERFYRADNNQNILSGSGLGLAICREIVELHGGKSGQKIMKRKEVVLVLKFLWMTE